jgi:acyl-coenzyme A synthetase/AMP-(fatty) acid ligase
LEYIGRNDFQVKIRGQRIELGEIENALTSIKKVKQACVLAKEKNITSLNDSYLIAYFTTENNITVEDNEILNQLSKKLPNYMIPNALMRIEIFPLTASLKLTTP